MIRLQSKKWYTGADTEYTGHARILSHPHCHGICIEHVSFSLYVIIVTRLFCDAASQVRSLPACLICHLKRFKYVEAAARLRKLMYRVAFPMELKLSNTTGTPMMCFVAIYIISCRRRHVHIRTWHGLRNAFRKLLVQASALWSLPVRQGTDAGSATYVARLGTPCVFACSPS